MHYFTPELFLRFNSTDDEIANRADEEWEAAIGNYREHLDRLRDRLPAPVWKLASLCLHDAELLAVDQPVEPFLDGPAEHAPTSPRLAIYSLRQGEEIVTLVYSLWDRVREYPSEGPWPFSTERTHWLYDELDIAPTGEGLSLHRVLWSDGTVVEIPFRSVLIHTIPINRIEQEEAAKRIA